jgi:hypothetical protein
MQLHVLVWRQGYRPPACILSRSASLGLACYLHGFGGWVGRSVFSPPEKLKDQLVLLRFMAVVTPGGAVVTPGGPTSAVCLAGDIMQDWYHDGDTLLRRFVQELPQ